MSFASCEANGCAHGLDLLTVSGGGLFIPSTNLRECKKGVLFEAIAYKACIGERFLFLSLECTF